MEQRCPEAMGPNSGVSPSPGEVSESPSRFNATEHAELKENRRSDVDPNPPTASRKRAHKVEPRLQGREPYSSISRGEIRCQDPLTSWPASCRPPRRWAAADRQATYRRVGKRYSDLVGVMRPIRIVQWWARCSAKAEGLPTPRLPARLRRRARAAHHPEWVNNRQEEGSCRSPRGHRHRRPRSWSRHRAAARHAQPCGGRQAHPGGRPGQQVGQGTGRQRKHRRVAHAQAHRGPAVGNPMGADRNIPVAGSLSNLGPLPGKELGL